MTGNIIPFAPDCLIPREIIETISIYNVCAFIFASCIV